MRRGEQERGGARRSEEGRAGARRGEEEQGGARPHMVPDVDPATACG